MALPKERVVDGVMSRWCPECRRWRPVDGFTRSSKLCAACRPQSDPVTVRCPECGAPAGVPCMSVELEAIEPHARRVRAAGGTT